MPTRNVLIVGQMSPPSTLSAARRIAGLAKYLSRLDYRVTVLTSVIAGSGPVPGAARTIRTRDAMVSPLNWRRRNFEQIAGKAAEPYEPEPSVLARILVPDLEIVGWAPFALATALRTVRRAPVDCVITSSPPQSGHLVGLALQPRGAAWIADFRDGWTFEPPNRPSYPLTAQRALDRSLEALVARRADAVTAVTPPITADLRERLGASASTISNGFDPDEAAGFAIDWEPPLSLERHSFVYTGSLAYGGSSPQPLLDALALLRARDPGVSGQIEMVFAGATSTAEQEAIADPRLGGIASTVGSLPRERALALQRAADTLVLFAGNHRPSVATGKLYEYLAARRPILVLGEDSAAAEIVRQAAAGWTVPEDDPEAIATALDNARRNPAPIPDPAATDQYSYAQVAQSMADQIELAISRRHEQTRTDQATGQ